MKKKCIIILYFLVAVYLYTQNVEYVPWGIWNETELESYSPIRELASGEYYCAGDWIGISQNGSGMVAGNIDYPVFAVYGEVIKIDKLEKVENGFILTLLGKGDRREKDSLIFKYNVQINLRMIFISENECMFKYESKADSDGFRLSFYAEEDRIYRRYRVLADDKKNDVNKKKPLYWIYKQTPYKETHIVIDNNVNLYENADINSEIIMKMSKDTKIQVIEISYIPGSKEPVITQGGITAPLVWIKTNNGTTGWCFSGQLIKINDTN